jgi:SAM-dependent methyltransferase
LARKAVSRVRLLIGLPDVEQKAYLSQKALVDSAYDGTNGTDTGGIQRIASLTVLGSNAPFAIDHIASDPADFHPAMTMVDISLESATFLDLGAGKGRAMLLAADYPFHRVIGVEFAQELYEKAQENIPRAGDDPRLAIIHGDATETVFPEGPLVIFMFNPFDAPIVRQVAENALASYRIDPRPMRILYSNPRCDDDVRRAGWTMVNEIPGHRLYAPAT